MYQNEESEIYALFLMFVILLVQIFLFDKTLRIHFQKVITNLQIIQNACIYANHATTSAKDICFSSRRTPLLSPYCRWESCGVSALTCQIMAFILFTEV